MIISGGGVGIEILSGRNSIQACYLGTDVLGTNLGPNTTGVEITNAASNTDRLRWPPMLPTSSPATLTA